MPSAIPLIRLIDAGAVLDLLRECNAPVESLMASARLPAGLTSNGQGFVSARSMLRFVGLAARSEGIEDLGWRAATRAPLELLGGWGRPAASRPTLRSAIGSFCRRYPQEVSFVEIGLSPGPGFAWLWRRRMVSASGWRGDSQGEQFMLGAMIQLVRRVAGTAWMPPGIRFESPHSRWTRRVSELATTPVKFGGSVLAIAVPYPLLDHCMPPPAHPHAGTPLAGETPAPDLAGSLRQALAPLLPEQPLTLGLGTEIAGVSDRTLRRRLREEGTSWREIVGEVRGQTAQKLLLCPEIAISEIAAQLGYSDQAHFTRSFGRWTGETPGAYRKRRLH